MEAPPMNFSAIVIGVFGFFNIIGGIIGYVKAQSIASLLSGGIAGILLLICAYGVTKNSSIAAYGTIVISLLLGGRFLTTMIKNFKVMPDLIIVVLSCLSIIAAILAQVKQ